MYDAIVLAGGAARRLGGADKPGLIVAGRTLLERALDAVADADLVVVVGDQRPSVHDVRWCREEPPGGGPVAAIAAGLPHTTAEVVILLAADLPWIAPAIPALLDALATAGGSTPAGAALLIDPSGRVNHLAAAWRRAALTSALHSVGDPHGAAMRAVTAAASGNASKWVSPVFVPDPAGWGRDCDTPADLTAARAAARAGDPR